MRGGATAEEIAAVIAAIAGRGPVEKPAGGYAAWRRGRLSALVRQLPGKPITER